MRFILLVILAFFLALTFVSLVRMHQPTVNPRVEAQAKIETQKILAKKPKEATCGCQAKTEQTQSKKNDDDDDFVTGWYMSPANPIGPVGSLIWGD